MARFWNGPHGGGGTREERNIISDAALARCLASIRKACGDTGNGQQVIKTLYGHGYRFIAAVEERPRTPLTSTVLVPTLQHDSQAPDSTAVCPAFPPSWDQDGPLQSACAPMPVLDEGQREVTVLCGAIAHTTGLVARLDSATMHCLVHGFFEHALRAVQRSGGRIQSFLDDSFLALFGVSAPCEDHAQRAVQAAMRLRRSLYTQGAALSALCGEPVAVCLGVHTGTVVGRRLGTDRRLTYMAMGDTIRWAMRLQQLAEPDTILLSDTTARRVQGTMDVEARGPVHVALGKQPRQRLRPAYVMNGQCASRSDTWGLRD